MSQVIKIVSLNFVLFFIFQMPLFGEIPLIRTNWGNSMSNLQTSMTESSMCLEILEDNILIIYAEIFVAHEDLENYPEIYLNYDWGGFQVGIAPAIMSENLTRITIDGVDMFKAVFEFVIDVSSYQFDDQSGFHYSLSLQMQDSQNNYVPYPTKQYSNQGELFSENQETSYNGSKLLCEARKELNLNAANDITNPAHKVMFKNEIKITDSPDAELKNNKSLKVFPNPFNNNFTLTLSENWNENAELLISNFSGKIIRQESLKHFMNTENTLKISTQHWPEGVYILAVYLENKTIHQTIVKNNF